MKKKKEEFYYKNLCSCVEIACEATKVLNETVKHYDRDVIKDKLAVMHELEQKGDAKRHKMMAALNKAFITPIEREDLVSLSNCLDDITDGVEDILLEIYMCDVAEIRKDVIPMLELLQKCIKALGEVMDELKDFKHSKTIEKCIINVNEIEEKGDQLFVENMHNLHMDKDVRTIIVWRNIYECIENCIDACEHTADIVSAVMMKNT